MIPIYDENRTGIKPVVTLSLIVINVVVFIYQLLLQPPKNLYFVYLFGFVPYLFSEAPFEHLYSLVTSMFLHGGFFHIMGNMVYLYIFGDNVEAAFRRIPFLVFYLFCGVLAALTHFILNVSSKIPTIGASGAISGVLGAYLVLYPRARIVSLVYLGWGYTFTRVSAKTFILFWFFYQFILILLGEQSGVAYWAHIGGFLAGLVIALVLKRKLLEDLSVLVGGDYV